MRLGALAAWLLLAYGARGLCRVGIGGIFQMRRSPASLQRELAARYAFCSVFPNCKPGLTEFVQPNPTTQSVYQMWAEDSTLGINVTYTLVSESSASSNTDTSMAIEQLIDLIIGFSIAAFVGPNSSSSSQSVSAITQVFNSPYISYAATSSELSSVTSYPYFFRVCPPDQNQADAIVAFIQKAGWTNIGVINSRDTYGSAGGAAVVNKADAASIVVNGQEELFAGERDASVVRSALNRLKAQGVRILVLFMSETDVGYLLQQATLLDMVGNGWTYISSDGFTSADFSAYGIESAASGFIGFAPTSVYNSAAFNTFLSNWTQNVNIAGNIITNFKNLSNTYTGLSTSAMPQNYAMYGQTPNSFSYFAHDAMRILLESIRTLASNGITPCTTTSLLTYRQALTDHLKNETVNATTGFVSFDTSQDRAVAEYDLQNHDGTQWNLISTWDSTVGFEFISPNTESNSPLWSDGTVGFANAPVSVVAVPETEEDDLTIYLYSLLALIPILTGLFYVLIKRKGEEWAEILGKVVNQSSKLTFNIVVGIVDFATDIFSFQYVLADKRFEDIIVAYTIFMILGGICIVGHTFFAINMLRSIMCKDETKYKVAEELVQNKDQHLMVEGKIVADVHTKKGLQFLLSKSYHGIRLELVGLFAAIFADVPFLCLNGLILVREGEVGIIILVSFAFNCFVCGTIPSSANELILNLDTAKVIITMIDRVHHPETDSPCDKKDAKSIQMRQIKRAESITTFTKSQRLKGSKIGDTLRDLYRESRISGSTPIMSRVQTDATPRGNRLSHPPNFSHSQAVGPSSWRASSKVHKTKVKKSKHRSDVRSSLPNPVTEEIKTNTSKAKQKDRSMSVSDISSI